MNTEDLYYGFSGIERNRRASVLSCSLRADSTRNGTGEIRRKNLQKGSRDKLKTSV